MFIAHLRPLLRQVATAFPHIVVELWAVDEYRIGLKPILDKLCVQIVLVRGLRGLA
jgi:hypothetical protein